MIQRIQTVYLFIAILLIGSLFFLPFTEMTNRNGEIFILDAKGLYPAASENLTPLFINTTILLLCAASIALLIITLVRFRYLRRQIILSKLSLVMQLIFSVVFYYEIWRAIQITGGNYSLKIFAAFPVIAMILTYLALRGIRRDDELIKSIDRIR